MQGRLYLLGRRDEMLKLGAERIYPLEIEDVIHSVEGVDEVVISKEVVEGTARPLYIYADRSDRTAEQGGASA